MSASATASALVAPDRAGFPRMALSSSAEACALAASREPIKTRWPALAQRSARPLPSAPVPPITAIVLCSDIGLPSNWLLRRRAERSRLLDVRHHFFGEILHLFVVFLQRIDGDHHRRAMIDAHGAQRLDLL